jgi:hypothetical protein
MAHHRPATLPRRRVGRIVAGRLERATKGGQVPDELGTCPSFFGSCTASRGKPPNSGPPAWETSPWLKPYQGRADRLMLLLQYPDRAARRPAMDWERAQGIFELRDEREEDPSLLEPLRLRLGVDGSHPGDQPREPR